MPMEIYHGSNKNEKQCSLAQDSANHYDDFRKSEHKQRTGIGSVLSEQSISNACRPWLWTPDHERHIYIRRVYNGITRGARVS